MAATIDLRARLLGCACVLRPACTCTHQCRCTLWPRPAQLRWGLPDSSQEGQAEWDSRLMQAPHPAACNYKQVRAEALLCFKQDSRGRCENQARTPPIHPPLWQQAARRYGRGGPHVFASPAAGCCCTLPAEPFMHNDTSGSGECTLALAALQGARSVDTNHFICECTCTARQRW